MSEKQIIVIGVDESGYGPLLGPLVVSGCAFSVPKDHFGEDLWLLLSKSVGDSKRGLDGRLLVADSKKAYQGPSDLPILEETVLSFLQQICITPAGFSELLVGIAKDLPQRTSFIPLKESYWYNDVWEEKVLPADVYDMKAKILEADLREHRISFLGARSICLEAEDYNEALQICGNNKANIVFNSVVELIKEAISLTYCSAPAPKLCIICDKLGGRAYYGSLLQQAFPGLGVSMYSHNGLNCAFYNLKGKDIDASVCFQAGADNLHFPVALASMFSKYTREKIMACMNRYFVRYVPGLKPTAGYWKDGLRFLKVLEEQDIFQKLSLPKEILVRRK